MRIAPLLAPMLLASPALADDAAAPVAGARLSETLGAELVSALNAEGDAATLARATQAFAAAGVGPCEGATARVVALAPRTDGSIPAYLLSRPAGGDGIYGGGHYRMDLLPSGGTGPLARFGDCQLLAWNSDDAEEENMQVAYLVRPGAQVPSEIDVLVSHELPFALAVVTGAKVWPVIGGSIADPVDADPEMGRQ